MWLAIDVDVSIHLGTYLWKLESTDGGPFRVNEMLLATICIVAPHHSQLITLM